MKQWCMKKMQGKGFADWQVKSALKWAKKVRDKRKIPSLMRATGMI